ncbi:glycosyltransferase family 4 protein [soil metagenome]
MAPGRVVYIVDRFPGVYQTFVEGEIRELIRRGILVRIFVRARGDLSGIPEDLRGVTATLPAGKRLLIRASIRILVKHPVRTLGALVWSLRALRRERGALHALADAAFIAPDLQGLDHVHAQFAHGSASVALALGRLTGRPFSFTAHAYDILVAGEPRILARKIAEARFTVAVSEFTRELMAGWARPEDYHKVVLVRNGIDLDAFGQEAPRTLSRPPLVLSVCRLVEKKGVDTAVQASAVLAGRGVEHRWEVLGDGPVRAELERLATELAVDDRFRFAGAQTPAQVHARLERATVFALPCRVAANGDHDVLPVAIIEAFAAGLPVVTTPIGGIPEVAVNERSALVIPPEDPNALADAIERLLGDESLRQRLIEGGRAVAAGYDKASSAARLIELFTNGPR